MDNLGPENPEVFERFGGSQVRRLMKLVDWARDLTGEFYRLSLDEAQRIPYEVRTLIKLRSNEIHQKAVLADIARYQYQEPHFGRKRDWYRVNLQDHNILRSLRLSKSSMGFSPLLLYVLTHEIVHVIRFVKYLAPFHSSEVERQDEEQRVHQITQQVLSRVPLNGMEQVIRHYQKQTEEFE